MYRMNSRTPIAVMKGYADTLVAGYVTDETKQKEYLQRIQSECNGMEHLVSDLLILSRMQTGLRIKCRSVKCDCRGTGCDAWNAYSYAGEKIDGQCYL